MRLTKRIVEEMIARLDPSYKVKKEGGRSFPESLKDAALAYFINETPGVCWKKDYAASVVREALQELHQNAMLEFGNQDHAGLE